jgi:hypothetical protein
MNALPPTHAPPEPAAQLRDEKADSPLLGKKAKKSVEMCDIGHTWKKIDADLTDIPRIPGGCKAKIVPLSVRGSTHPPAALASRMMSLRPPRATCAKTFRSVTRFTFRPLGAGLTSRRIVTGRAGTHRKEASVDVAAWLHGLAMQQYGPAFQNARSTLPDLTMLNLEDPGMSQVAVRDRPLAAIAAASIWRTSGHFPTECACSTVLAS